MEWHYSEDRKRIILEEPPKKKLRISGHRLPTILGVNEYSTPFQAWCEITKLISKPFEENKYIIAGRILEPKLIDYVREKFPNIKSMEEYYGNVIDVYRYNNFKDDSNIFGGVFDFVSTKNNGIDIAMLGEIKTSSHPEQYVDNNVPISYCLQAGLYTTLKGLDRMLFVVCFLKDMDYAHPEFFIPNETNTKLIVKKLDDMIFDINGEYLNVKGCMDKAEAWWHDFIETGISPEFDEVRDKEYLDIIRKSKPSNDNDLVTLCNEAINLAKEIKQIKIDIGLDTKDKELKTIEKAIKEVMLEKDVDNCGAYSLKRKESKVFNEDLFAKENEKLYNKYCEDKINYTLSKNLKEEM